MHDTCSNNCEPAGKPVQYLCDCGCGGCKVIEFDEVPSAVPYCCGSSMKRMR